jgi:hypothetical protein
VLRIAIQLALILSCGIAVFAQAPETPIVNTGLYEIYLAKDDGTGKAGEEATSFVTTDVPIYCVVQLDSPTPVTVTMNLIAVAVPGVKGGTRVVSTSYTTRDNQNRVNFSGRPAGEWVAGRYRVDIFIGDKAVASREFAVQKSVVAKPAPKPTPTKSGDKSRFAGRTRNN